MKNSVKIVGNPSKIQTGYLPNTSPEHYCHTSPFNEGHAL